jgi:sterol desaturase/sphingolipid hydroxylase (fatty acid hydroxylase superfamily)
VELSPGIVYFGNQMRKVFLSSGSSFSLTSLACALVVAAAFIAIKRYRKNRRIRVRTIMRALFQARFFKNPSSAIDAGYLYLNLFVVSIAISWAILSYQFLTNSLISALTVLFGALQPSTLSPLLSQGIITVILFLAYEIGYWLHHWLSHRIPLMWEFHKVHHTAEVLTPLTNFRVHPVDTIFFVNILAITTAIANGLTRYLFGDSSHQYALSDTNIILVVFIHAYLHLQHTHLWIPFRGLLGRLLMSPAHHQVHHSMNPAHFNRNFGSCLALWDWLFGTLYVPQKQREHIVFGVEPDR